MSRSIAYSPRADQKIQPKRVINNEEINGTRSQAILMKYKSAMTSIKMNKSALDNSSRVLSNVIGDLHDDIECDRISEKSSSEA